MQGCKAKNSGKSEQICEQCVNIQERIGQKQNHEANILKHMVKIKVQIKMIKDMSKLAKMTSFEVNQELKLGGTVDYQKK